MVAECCTGVEHVQRATCCCSFAIALVAALSSAVRVAFVVVSILTALRSASVADARLARAVVCSRPKL